MNNNNTFLLEICNLWDNTNPRIPSVFSMYFLFKANENETYFSMPNLCLKISNKGAADRSEVRLFVDYLETMGLFNTLTNYLTNKQKINVSFGNGRYFFSLTNFENQYTLINLSNTQKQVGMTFKVHTNIMYQITQTLKTVIQELQKTSLMFIQIIQNQKRNDLLNEIKSLLSNINSNVNNIDLNKILNNSLSTLGQNSIESNQLNAEIPTHRNGYMDTLNNEIPSNAIVTNAENNEWFIADDIVENTETVTNSNNNINNQKIITNDKIEIQDKISIVQKQVNINQNTETVTNSNNSNNLNSLSTLGQNSIESNNLDMSLSNKLDMTIQKNLEKVTVPKLIEEIKKYLEEKSNIFEYGWYKDFLIRMSIYLPNLPQFDEIRKNVNMTKSGFEYYLMTLAFISNKNVSGNQPMYCLKFKDNSILERMGLLSEAIATLFFSGKCNQKELNFCRIFFAPFWMTYYGVFPNNIKSLGSNSEQVFQIIKKYIPVFISSPFWENKFIKEVIVSYVKSIVPAGSKPFNNIGYADNVVQQFFALYFYSNNVCKNINYFLELKEEIIDVITILSNTNNYQELCNNERQYNFKKYSTDFLRAISIFSNENKDKFKTLEQIENLYRLKTTDANFNSDSFISILDALNTL